MVADDLIDLQESYLPMWIRAWRCVACGNIVDALIHRHRMGEQARTVNVDLTIPRFTPPAKAAHTG